MNNVSLTIEGRSSAYCCVVQRLLTTLKLLLAARNPQSFVSFSILVFPLALHKYKVYFPYTACLFLLILLLDRPSQVESSVSRSRKRQRKLSGERIQKRVYRHVSAFVAHFLVFLFCSTALVRRRLASGVPLMSAPTQQHRWWHIC